MTTDNLPKHIAIIMDGNGRWAKRKKLPRIAGHRAGMEAVRKIIKLCAEKGIEQLTLFAFSSENWQRPTQEVNDLMELFLSALKKEVKRLHKNNIRLRIIGELTKFSDTLRHWIKKSEELTQFNTGMTLNIAANYGGRWDITQAAKKICQDVVSGRCQIEDISEQAFAEYLCLAGTIEPDLFIRTSGELRISNFLIWQLAYTEMYFSDILWPDFDEQQLENALAFFASRERRFGCTSEQIKQKASG